MKNLPEALTFDDVLLVPRYSEVRTRRDVSLTARLSPKKDLTLAPPFLSANMDTVTGEEMAQTMAEAGGLGVIHRFMTVEEQVAAVGRLKERGLVAGAAFGVKEGELDRAEALLEAGVDVLVLDIAHGHSVRSLETIKAFRQRFSDAFLVAGNVATPEGVFDLAEAGADTVKVGIGGGSVCSTRIVTGFGIPQMTTLFECVGAADEAGVGLIADGGIRYSGDIVKALAAGADAVMIGNILAGTDQAPGEKISKDSVFYKQYRGMASREANSHRKDREVELSQLIVEGVSGLVPYRGDARIVLDQLEGGLRSGLSYAGALNLRDLRKNARFIKITAAGWKESHPHSIWSKPKSE